jgi:hypothetical protein
MNRLCFNTIRRASILALCILTPSLPAEPSPAAVSAFDAYAAAVESRLVRQHQGATSILATTDDSRLRNGELVIEHVSEPSANSTNPPGAILHHWRGTAFARGANAADFLILMRGFDSYPQYFSPEVVAAHTISQKGGHIQASMRIRQRHVITVVMDSAYDVAFTPVDAKHGYSISRSTRIQEVASPGTPQEHALSSSEEHGFLYRLNTYWSYEERDGGLYLQVEAVSLSRSIPTGLGWAVGPYVESIPRESLEFTLRSATNALRR